MDVRRISGWVVAFGIALIAGLPALAHAQTAPTSEVTFTKAHRADPSAQLRELPPPGRRRADVAPTYEEVRPWARAIKQRTGIGPHAGVMPPWYVEKNIGIQKFKNDPSLSDERDRDDREVGRQRRAARQSRRHAAAAGSGTTRTKWSIGNAGSRREDERRRGQGERARLVGRDSARADRPHRRSLRRRRSK